MDSLPNAGRGFLQTVAAAQPASSSSTSESEEEEDDGMDADELKVLCKL